MTRVRTRFPPSPTGPLHLGGARTALFNWLFARHHKGKFILRIEDSDPERSRPEHTENIMEGLKWLGLNWDEGPYLQSQRLEIYREHVDRLLKEDKAYRCYCTPEELEAKRKAALARGEKPRYDGTCREIGRKELGKPFAVRFRVRDSGETVVDDLIRGPVVFDNRELDDLIIARSDGTPTYNFSVVVDDATMGITHVIRGDDHLNNTPKQTQLYQALGYPLPRFAHVPLIHGEDKARLSKRHGATSVLAYRDMGYLPEAMVNYLARLGWAHGDEEIFSLEELIEKFDLEGVGKSPAAFNPEKLIWLNGHYIRQKEGWELARLLLPFIEARGFQVEREDWLAKVAETLKERAKTLVEMASMSEFYLVDKVQYQVEPARGFLTPALLEPFKALVRQLGRLPYFTREEVEPVVKGVARDYGLRFADFAQPIRVALTGGTTSPPLFDIMEVLEKRKVILRLNEAISHIEARASAEP